MLLATGTSGRNFSARDHLLVEDLAQRVAFALENARLYSKAWKAVQSREDVLSMVSHDLKNPIAAIQLSAQLLDKQIERFQLPTDLHKVVEILQASASSMDALIQSILDMGKIQAGTFSVDPRPLELRSALNSAIALLSPLATAKNIQLELEGTSHLLVANADQNRVLQVLSNLIGNAIKFTPNGGKVTVSSELDGAAVKISVRDNGPGIPADQIPYLFARHWQAMSAATRGSGLGLFISRGIVEAHRGKIWVESEVGKGSCFSFTLPATQFAFGTHSEKLFSAAK